MQGVVFMPENPQQGSPPPNNSPAPAMTMEVSPVTQDKPLNQSSDSGIFSATSNSTLEPLDQRSLESDSDHRSDCSSPTARKYVCPICETVLTSQHHFTLHIRSHNNDAELQEAEKGFACRICRKVLSSSSSLDRHVLVHSGERPFHCKHCGDTFTTNGNMHRHMRTHSHKAEQYESDSDSAKSTEYNNNHVEMRTNKRKLEHHEEDSRKRIELMGSDSEEQEEQVYKCPVCDRNDFHSIMGLETHLEDNHPDYPAKCHQCHQSFNNNKQLMAHRAAIHDNIKPKQVLGFPDLTFVDFSSQKFPHIARHECEKNLHKASGGLKFQCKNCTRAFPCANSLDIHQKECITHANNGLDLTKSALSEKEMRRSDFFSRLDLQDNSPEKPSNGPIIDPTTKLKQQLLAKAMNFESNKDFADIQSIISMTSNGSLLQQLHAKNDSMKSGDSLDSGRGEPEEESQDFFAVEFRKMKLRGEFPCRLCTAVFPNLRALKGHNRAHLNGNNNGMYRCNMCPHSSIDKAALIRHMRTHNGDRPYECALCNYAFTTKANCERHLRNRHAKTTREEVKSSIIYHPSEDPTNEELNKLTTRDDIRKTLNNDDSRMVPEMKMEVSPLLPTLLKDTLSVPPTPDPSKMFANISDIIRNENIKSLREHRPYLQQRPSFAPKPMNVSTPLNVPSKIQVKSIDDLKEMHYDESDEDDGEDEPMNLVLDLSKKKDDDSPRSAAPEDLSQRSPSVKQPLEIFGQFLKTPPKMDRAALYATQLALYRGAFPGLTGWPMNPLLFPSLSNPLLSPENQDIKERLQRYQLCGGSMIRDEFAERLKNYTPSFPNYDFSPELKDSNSNPTSENFNKPLSLNVENNFNDSFNKLQSPVSQGSKQDLMQSPNSVKMVIKNGVLMPKQKQRRYRTERPFTCEHCSAKFTLRSNMERHIKQQHPQYWSQRQRGHIGNPGRKGHPTLKSNFCDINIPNYELPKNQEFEETKELKYAILAQHLRNQAHYDLKKDEDEDGELVIDENEEKTDDTNQRDYRRSHILEDKLKELHAKQMKCESKVKSEEDLVPVSRLLDNASQQQFKEYFKRESEEAEVAASEEDEEGLVASGSTSEGNISGTDENRSESEITSPPAKKKSAYSMAPNRVSCPFCSRKFPWSSSLRRHILTHTGQKPFKCSHCPLLFTTKSNCDRHLLRKHGNSATTISNDAANNNDTKYLMRNVPERPFKCANCPSSTFSTYSNLKKHISCKHNTCEDAKAQGYEAGSSEDEKKDEWEGQTRGPEPPSGAPSDLPFKCHLCDGSFSERQDALDHIKEKHFSEYDLLMSKNALDSSATIPEDGVHQEDEDHEMRGKFPDYSNRKVICAFCMRRFWSAEDLRRHMRTHTGERPFSCDICRRRFTLKHSMLRHRKKHNVHFDNENVNSDEEVSSVPASFENANEGGDLISNLLGIRRDFIDRVLTGSADDAAKLLGVKNGGVKE